MKLKIDGNNIYCTAQNAGDFESKLPLLFLHGFAGSSEDWLNIIPKLDSTFAPFAIDLIGHGKSDAPLDTNFYTQQAIEEHIKSVLDYFSIDKVVICGYSMGGRAALSFYFSYPEHIKGLILESTNPGISSDKEVIERINSDNKLAEFLESSDMKSFIDYWYGLPLFNSLSNLHPDEYSSMLKTRYSNSVIGLANSLKGFGTGSMNNWWPLLKKVNIPALLIAGELDKKYTGISKKASELIPASERNIIVSAGHNTHLEKPIEFVSLVNSFLRNYFV